MNAPCCSHRGAVLENAVRAILLGLALGTATAVAWSAERPAAVDDAADALVEPLEFMRVHVPAGRLADVPLGDSRYVPMSAREFEAGLARITAGAGAAMPPATRAIADTVRYAMHLADDGGLDGTLAADVGDPAAASIGQELSLGALDVRSGSMQSDAGQGEAVIFGRGDGTIAVATPRPGTYTCSFRLRPAGGDAGQRRFVLPLAPALASRISIDLPPGLQPIVAGWGAMNRAAVEVGGLVRWQIEIGPQPAVEISFFAENTAPRLTAWSSLRIEGRQVEQNVLVRPTAPWFDTRLRLEKSPAVIVTGVVVSAAQTNAATEAVSWAVADDGRSFTVLLPAASIGSRSQVLVTAIAPVTGGAAPLPRVQPPAAAWAGGGVGLEVDPGYAIDSIRFEHGLIVPPEVAAHWPLPQPVEVARIATAASAPTGRRSAPPAGLAVQPARLFFEEQAPEAVVTLSLAARAAVLDVARVTTVELAAGLVVGRAACDVRVLRGEAFDITARVTPGWFIDSVERFTPVAPSELTDAALSRDADDPVAGLDWRVQRDAGGGVLRIGLAAAATPDRGLGLRITGHRAGLALGEAFATGDLDMVQLDGEADRSTLLDLRMSPETTLDLDADGAAGPLQTGPPAGDSGDARGVEADARLAALVEEGAVRAQLAAGVRAASVGARLVRRRPPLDARTQVRLTVRDDRLVESFTFECRPTTADLDSIVVQFSEPLDDLVEWSLLPPAVGTVTPRRLEPTDRRGAGAGDRWLLEVSPAARGPITIRGHRTVPFARPVPVPLAWVEGSTSDFGQVVVRSVGRARPRVVNRRLSELPPEPGTGQADAFTIAEFAFTATTADGPGLPAAELVPADGDSRAWAWLERTSSWSHTSGTTEHETRFDIENQGRDSLSISLPPGRQVQSVLLDGERLALGDRASAGGELKVVLPPGRTRLAVVVRSVTERAASPWWLAATAWPAWRVDAPTVAVDVPVLDREWLLLLPPELELATVGGAMRLVEERDDVGWTARLLGAGPRAVRAEKGAGDGSRSEGGWRPCRLVPAGGGVGAATAFVVRTWAVAVGAAVLGIVVGGGTLWLGAASGWAALVACLIAGVTALWVTPPFDLVARAAWWATVAAVVASWSGAGPRRWPFRTWAGMRPLVALVVVVGSSVAARADESPAAARPDAVEPLKVFMTPPDGGPPGDATVLVPQPLFRAIVRGEEGQASALRVLSVTVTAAEVPRGESAWGPWRLAVNVDADAAGELALDQPPGNARFVPATLRVDGVPATGRTRADESRLRVACAEPGRHLVTIDMVPVGRREGDIETVLLALPPAASASVEFSAADPAVLVEYETATAAGEFTAAVPAADRTGPARYDVTLARRLRVRRALTSGGGLVAAPPTAESRNDVSWGLDACRVTAAFEVDAGADILPGCVVQADPGLEWVAVSGGADDVLDSAAADADVRIRRLGSGRYQVERRRPTRGRFRFEMVFRMPLADAVGVFEVPGAWLENAAKESRAVRFAASASLGVRIDLPPGLSHSSSPEGESSFETRFWRGDAVRPDPRTVGAGRLPVAYPRAQLRSERRRQDLRGSQRESIVFTADQVRIDLDARLDATATALVVIPLEVPAACVLDRVVLFEDDLLQPDTADRDPLDVRWSRTAPTTVEVVVQQPRAGRFRLDVAARIPRRPPARGPLPCLRVQLADGARTIVDWRTETAQRVAILPPEGDSATSADHGRPAAVGQIDLVAGDALPEYVLEAAPSDAAAGSDGAADEDAAAGQSLASAPEEPAARDARVELADIRLVIDDRGRAWGLGAFDLVATEAIVQIMLPRSWRLFDAAVDGRPADGIQALPGPDNVWSVPLLDPGWPRRLVVLFAGELFAGEAGRRLLDGEPLELSAPAVVGLPCSRMVWTLRPPPGLSLRVAAPARIVSADVLDGEREAAGERLREEFELAARHASPSEQDRLRRFAQDRSTGGRRSIDDAWSRAWQAAEADAGRSPPLPIVAAAAAGRADGRLVIRAVRPRDGSVRGRAVATLMLVACGAVAWLAWRRGWAGRLGIAAPLVEAVTVAGGLAWLAALDPAWPGGLLIVAGGAALARRWWPRRAAVVVPPQPSAAATATTIFRPPPAAGGSTASAAASRE